jgi:hypothetical protein
MVIWGMVYGIASPTLMMYMAPKEKGDDHLHFMAKQLGVLTTENICCTSFFNGISHVILPFPKGHPSTNRILRYFDDFSPSPSTKITKSSEKHKKKWRTTPVKTAAMVSNTAPRFSQATRMDLVQWFVHRDSLMNS